MRRIMHVAVIATFLAVFPKAAAAEDPIFSVIRNRLPNGLEVWIKPRATTRAVDVRVVVKTGHRYEEPRDSGLAHLVEHLMFKGTRLHDDVALRRIIRSKGGYSNAYTTAEDTFYQVSIVDREFPIALSYLHEILTQSLMSEKGLQQAREDVYSEQQGKYAKPLVKLFESGFFQPLEVRVPALAFPSARLPQRIVSDLEHIAVSRVRAFWSNYYVPNNMAVIVVGNVDPEDVMQRVTALFGSMPAREVAAPSYVRVGAPRRLPGEVRTLIYPPIGQMTTIWRGTWTGGLKDPDRWPLTLIRTWLERRAFADVRLRNALGYDVGATDYSLSDVGILNVHAEVRRSRDEERKTNEIIDAILSELRSQGMTAADLEEAKATIVGQYVRRENNASLAAIYQEQFLTTPFGEPLENSIEAIERVSAADILRVARTRFAEERIFRAAARPPITYTGAAALGIAIAVAIVLLVFAAIRRRTARRKTMTMDHTASTDAVSPRAEITAT